LIAQTKRQTLPAQNYRDVQHKIAMRIPNYNGGNLISIMAVRDRYSPQIRLLTQLIMELAGRWVRH
jgi:hypothetical protein